jgi:hypothetical protein
MQIVNGQGVFDLGIDDNEVAQPAEDPRRDAFIAKARAKHSDRYTYEQVVYINSTTTVIITCPRHGNFEQRPGQHVYGSGCPECGGVKRHTAATFVAAARTVHGDKFGYDLVVYKSNKDRVKIICPQHGVFEPTPNNHLRGQGCRACAGHMPLTTAVFAERATAVHGGAYTYEAVEYTNIDEKVVISCPVHGQFSQIAYDHLAGHGCQACAGNLRLTTAEFITRARSRHGGKYDYDLVEYINSTTKVTIVCRDHGSFSQTPETHMNGGGCIDCAGTRQHTAETFAAKSRHIHGEKYSYELVEYTSNKDKVTITCPEHGGFEQKANNHLNGAGCPICAGNQKRDTDTFTAMAHEVHGSRYGYELVDYVSNGTSVNIRCADHGVFPQSPYMHLTGQGCPACAGNQKLTIEEFVLRARETHGDTYDYTKAEYSCGNSRLTIICHEHGEFEQFARNHMTGAGCRKCSGLHPLDNATFIARSKEVHGDRYGYELVEYVNVSTPVTIVCPVHGPFKQLPSNHFSGNGCWECSGLKPWTTEMFVARARQVHGEKYGYELVEYVNGPTAVTISCPIHGLFTQSAKTHADGGGCRACARRLPYTSATFTEAARKIHGDKYGYDLVEYTYALTKVVITCPVHGPFSQTPNGHLSGYGCRLCKESQPERIIAVLLAEAGIPAEPQWRNESLRNELPLSIDFMLPETRTLIEYDGPFHHAPQYWAHESEDEAIAAFERQQLRDRIKDTWAADQGWKLVRLSGPRTIKKDLIAAGVLPAVPELA